MTATRRNELDWRRHLMRAHVVRSPRGTAVRVNGDVLLMLVWMSSNLNNNLIYSSGRQRLADALGCSPATVSRWLHDAVEVGLLAHLSKGRVGHYAEYQALFPEIVVGSEAQRARSLRGKVGRPQGRNDDPLRAAQHGEPPLLISNTQPEEDNWLSPGDPPF